MYRLVDWGVGYSCLQPADEVADHLTLGLALSSSGMSCPVRKQSRLFGFEEIRIDLGLMLKHIKTDARDFTAFHSAYKRLFVND